MIKLIAAYLSTITIIYAIAYTTTFEEVWWTIGTVIVLSLLCLGGVIWCIGQTISYVEDH